MAKKNRPQLPPKPAQFSSTPFSALKGVAVPTQPEKTEKVAPPPTPLPPVEDADALFLQAMAGAKPLHTPPQPVVPSLKNGKTPSVQPAKTPKGPSAEEKAAAELFNQEIGRLKLEVKFTEQRPDEDELKALGGNRLRQLKRGIISVDHQLDLHGLSRDEALAELPRFLNSARLRGQSAALIITGKGLNSPGEPILQQAVAGWLRDAGRELVVEYAPAPREMGGSGAFVVFLRNPAKQSTTPP
jgi:DNA-nicking Smr family endonuclease